MNRHEKHMLARLSGGRKINKPLVADLLRVGRSKLHDQESRDTLAMRAALADNVRKAAVSGWVGVYVWQMDCDCASWDGLTIMPAHALRQIEKRIDDLYANAEGPVRWNFTDPYRASDFIPTHRDHALEAFEDGHPHYVTI